MANEPDKRSYSLAFSASFSLPITLRYYMIKYALFPLVASDCLFPLNEAFTRFLIENIFACTLYDESAKKQLWKQRASTFEDR